MEENKDLLNDKLEIDLNQEFTKLLSKLTDAKSIVSTIITNDLVNDFNDFTEKIINRIGVKYLSDDTIWNALAAELVNYNDYINSFFNKLDLNVLKSGIEDKLYYELLKHKYSDLDFFIQQFWSKLNIDKLGINEKIFDIDQYKKLDNIKQYKEILELLKNNKDNFLNIIKSNLNKLKGDKIPPYQVFRYIFLKSNKFRSKVLDEILELDKENLKGKYDKFKRIVNVYQNKISYLKDNPILYNIEDKLNKKLEEIKEKGLNANTYFELNKFKESLKANLDDKQFRAYVLKYLLENYMKNLPFIDNNTIEKQIISKISMKEYTNIFIPIPEEKILNTLKNIKDKDNSNLNQKKETLQIYKNLIQIKNIILQVEEKNFYAPWLKVFIKQGLAERLNFDSEGIRRLQYVLYFVISKNYSEYFYLKKFFDDIENIYQKKDYPKIFLNTLSLLILAILLYIFLIYFINSPIYHTLFFIIVGILFYVSWYIKFFKLDFSDNKLISRIIFVGLSLIGSIIFFFTSGIYGVNLIAILGLFLFIVALFDLIVSFESLKSINSGVYKVTSILFLFMLFLGLSQNQGLQNTFIEKGKNISSNIVGEKLAADLFTTGSKSEIWKNNPVYTYLIKDKSNYVIPYKESIYTDILNRK